MKTLLSLVALATPLLLTTAASASPEVFQVNGFAIRGYDPVAYFTEKKPVKGSKDYSASWLGATWLFKDAKNRDTFKSDPARWAPQFGGYCAYAAANGRKAKTEPEAFSVVGGKLYLNYDLSVQEKWQANREEYIRQANEKWPALKSK